MYGRGGRGVRAPRGLGGAVARLGRRRAPHREGRSTGNEEEAERMQIPIERYTVENGLHVVLSQDHTLPGVSLNLWYNVGSRNEVPGRTGLAHLFEHMMFQGSQNVPGTQHIALVER